MELVDKDQNIFTFEFEASKLQIAEYLAIPVINVMPVESSGYKLFSNLMEFLYPQSDVEWNARLEKAQESNPLLDSRSFIHHLINDFGSTFKTRAVSIGGPGFDNASNISIEEVKLAVKAIKPLQVQSFGTVDLLAPNLYAEQILAVYNQFDGEMSSYTSNRRNISTLLFENYPGLLHSPLVNPCSLDVLDKIDKRMFSIPPRVVDMYCRMDDDNTHHFRLDNHPGKTDLKEYSKTKKNGTRFLDATSLKFSLKTGTEDFESSCQYNFANISSVSPLVNADTLKYRAGNAVVREVEHGGDRPVDVEQDVPTGKYYSVTIPVKEPIDFTTKKSDEGYVIFISLSLILDPRYEKTITAHPHCPVAYPFPTPAPPTPPSTTPPPDNATNPDYIKWRVEYPDKKSEWRSGAKDYASMYASYVPSGDSTIADQYYPLTCLDSNTSLVLASRIAKRKSSSIVCGVISRLSCGPMIQSLIRPNSPSTTTLVLGSLSLEIPREEW
jgi:hypothetical protein